MLFNNPKFFIFLFVVLSLMLFGNKNYRKLVLLFSSYIFYSFWDWRFLALILISTVVDFFIGKKIYESENEKYQRSFLIVSICVNLGILGFFKYFNFFTDSLELLLNNFNISESHFSTLNIILPVGISFYTFQTMSYTIDVYRKQLTPSNSFLDFSIFVSFFPQLVAGPIERAKNLLPQIEKFNGLKKADIINAIHILFLGYVQKVLIADNLAPISDSCFNNYESLSSIYLVSGLITFSLQIYFDFAGYSNIARGVAKIFGIDLMINFNQPYFSSNISEFWKRWHISLSEWLRDYLYIPLGGNKKGKFRTYNNLMITMILGGLWHGASWNFILWGGIHGCYLVLFKIFGTNNIKNSLLKILNVMFVYGLVLITWIPFRAKNIQVSLDFLKKIILWEGAVTLSELLFILFLFLILIIMDLPAYFYKTQDFLKKRPLWIQLSLFLIGISGIILTFIINQNNVRPFIYFQF
tara:strand:+ start:46 stop:1449 length:1404 start_codon:yes stop_codon:yes gene_type:complete